MMKAVILAAGVGSRLAPITNNKPKCLVRVSGKSILESQIDALLGAGIQEVCIVGGYCIEQVEKTIEPYTCSGKVRILQNKEYDVTNNMYSLWLSKSFVQNEGFILLNGDVVVADSVISDLVFADGTRVCTDEGAYNEESMKICLGSNGCVCRISKTITASEAYGCSIDVYRFDEDDSQLLFSYVDMVVTSGNRNDWTEVALDALFSKGEITARPFCIGDRPWYEIDDLEDLATASNIFAKERLDWKQKRIAFVDMDGTLFCGNKMIPGADAFCRSLRERVEYVRFLSNNSSKSHSEYVRKLAQFGISASESDILLSTDGLATALTSAGIDRAYVLGTDALKDELRRLGVRHCTEDVGCLVLGYDTELTYQKLVDACLLLQNPDIVFWATHCDVVCPTEFGAIPDIGATMALIESTCGRRPDRIFGKPDVHMLDWLTDELSIRPEHCVMIGDRVYTDYEMARRFGMQFVGVLTGDSDLLAYQECLDALIFNSVASIFGEDI